MTNPKFAWKPSVGGVPAQIAIVKNTIYATTLLGERLWRLPIDSSGQNIGAATAYYSRVYGRLRGIAGVPGADQLWVATSDRGTGKDLILKVTIK